MSRSPPHSVVYYCGHFMSRSPLYFQLEISTVGGTDECPIAIAQEEKRLEKWVEIGVTSHAKSGRLLILYCKYKSLPLWGAEVKTPRL